MFRPYTLKSIIKASGVLPAGLLEINREWQGIKRELPTIQEMKNYVTLRNLTN